MGVVSAHQREQPELPSAFTVTNPGTIVEEPFSPWGFAAGLITYMDPDTGKFCKGVQYPTEHRSGTVKIWVGGQGSATGTVSDPIYRTGMTVWGSCLAPFDH